jgi:hypothetical protein
MITFFLHNLDWRRFLKMIREFNVVIEKDEDGYLVASVPELPRVPYTG